MKLVRFMDLKVAWIVWKSGYTMDKSEAANQSTLFNLKWGLCIYFILVHLIDIIKGYGKMVSYYWKHVMNYFLKTLNI